MIFQNSNPFQRRFPLKGKSSKILYVTASTEPTASRHSPFWARSCISVLTAILKLIKLRQVRVPYSGSHRKEREASRNSHVTSYTCGTFYWCNLQSCSCLILRSIYSYLHVRCRALMFRKTNTSTHRTYYIDTWCVLYLFKNTLQSGLNLKLLQ